MRNLDEEKILKLQEKISKKQRERDAWQGKSSENFKMASLLVASLERELSRLLSNRET